MSKTVVINGISRFKTRSDTLANWNAKNPVLLSGEPSVVTDGSETEKIKFGDGVTPWAELNYWMGPKGKTPEKGVDYYTEEDKAEMVDLVLAALPNGDEVAY